MMQSNTLAQLPLNLRIMDPPQRNMPKDVNKGSDTFMDVLSEKLQARQDANARSTPAAKAEKFSVKNDLQNDNVVKSSVKNSASSPEKAEANESDVQKTSQPKDSKAIVQNAETEDQTDQEIKDQITSLEAMVSLLQELMARLDVKTVSADPVQAETGVEPLQAGAQSIDPMKLLKALLEGNAEKLKSLLGQMDGGQQTPELNGIMEKIQNLLNKMSEDQKGSDGSLSLDLEIMNEGASREDLINQLKAQCSEGIDKLKEQISELKASLQQETKPEGMSIDSVQNLAGKSSVSDQEQPGLSTSSTDNEPKAELKSEPKAAQADEKPHQSVKPHESVKGQEVPDNKSIDGNFTIPAEPKLQDTSGVKTEKTPLPLPEKPLASTVTNQVMMKVKLMAGENKQEMEMHLKPESLGKLSLRIIHERGEILAKITAENEQVKGIIESNMQLLKDALEKSGLSVQSLNVSVGNGDQKNQTRQELNDSSRPGFRNLGGVQKTAGAAEALNARTRIRDLFDQSSQINLTA